MVRTIRVGHTPDMDDAFMFYAIASGAMPTDGFSFEHVIEDIQALNRRALSGELDLSAISAASLPDISDHYWVTSVGSSIGQNYGPLVIANNPCTPEDLAGKRIAIPGISTTAYLLLRLAIPQFVPIEMNFDKIPQSILKHEVEAGLVIHEWQLTYRDANLLPILDLGMWWQQETHLPLPLGLNVVKRALGRKMAVAITTLLRDSILYSFAHQEEALAYAIRYGRGIDQKRARQFVGMYVNEESLTLSKSCQEAMRILFERAHSNGLIQSVPKLDIIEPAKS